VNDTASLLLLFVAAGLLIVLGTGLGRARGRSPSARDTSLMAGMTGLAIGFLVVFLSASALAFGPIGIAVVLVAAWWRRGQTGLIGAFLLGGGVLVAFMNGMWLLNDLSDPAVSYPGWMPGMLAGAIAAVILGASFVLAAGRERG
jgi:hypothetical protein